MKRPTWDEYFISQVDSLSLRATCDRGRSAAVFVRDRGILTSGYVGSPPGFPHCDDVGHLWSEDGKHCLRTVHAEQNAVVWSARLGISLREATVYCTMEPCRNCAMTLIGIGVTRVVAKNAYHAAEWTREAFAEAGIELKVLDKSTLYTEQSGCGATSGGDDFCTVPQSPHVCGIAANIRHSVHECTICGEPFYGGRIER